MIQRSDGMTAVSHPLDDEALEDIVFTVTAIHKSTGQVGVATNDDPQIALRDAKDDLLGKLEIVGGG